MLRSRYIRASKIFCTRELFLTDRFFAVLLLQVHDSRNVLQTFCFVFFRWRIVRSTYFHPSVRPQIVYASRIPPRPIGGSRSGDRQVGVLEASDFGIPEWSEMAMEWNRMEWDGTARNGMERNGVEWKWNGMEWNGME